MFPVKYIVYGIGGKCCLGYHGCHAGEIIRLFAYRPVTTVITLDGMLPGPHNRNMIHAFVDGSIHPGTGRAGIGIAITVSPGRTIGFARPCSARTSMQAELAAAAAALDWLRPGTTACICVDNPATAAAILRDRSLYGHLRDLTVVVVTAGDGMAAAHALAAHGARGITVPEHNLPAYAAVVFRPSRRSGP